MGLGAAGTAAVIAGGVGAAGSVASSAIGSSAASSAANTQAAAADNASAEQQAAGQQALTLNQQGLDAAQNRLEPYNLQGQTALNSVNANMNYLTTPYSPTKAQLAATPGYRFTRAQGLQATQNAAAAQGLGVSGDALKAAAGYATGLANSTYQTDANIYQQNQAQIGNLLTTLTNNGQNAATAQAQLGLGFVGNETNALIGQANNSAQTQLTGAQATAAGTVGSANALSSGLTGAASSASQGYLLNALIAQNTGSKYAGTTYPTAAAAAAGGGYETPYG